MIAIIDYGVGNVFSLSSSLKKIGAECIVTDDIAQICGAEGVILPGVGAFGDASDKLKERGLDKAVKDLAFNGKPLLGICLGMQLLFDRSYEYGEHEGLGLIGGEVRPLSQYIDGLKIPHMGWNSLGLQRDDCPLLKYTQGGDYVYFVHSFCAVCSDEGDLMATSHYGTDVTAVVARGNVFGTQFHPEKSGEVGLKMLKAFVELSQQAGKKLC